MKEQRVWEIFGFEGCEFCDRSKEFLKENNEVFISIDIKEKPGMKKLMLDRVPEAKTVPQIFLHRFSIPLLENEQKSETTYVGGCDDLIAKYNDLVEQI